jgi:hypothetical protein
MFMHTLENKVFEALNSNDGLAVMKELESLGDGAIPLLEAVLSGEAKNKFGVAYGNLGMPLTRALIVARHLGPKSKPLEKYFIIELNNKHREAPSTIGALADISDEGIEALIGSLGDDILYSLEVATVLKKLGLLNHVSVQRAMAISPVARKAIEAVKNA